MKKAILATKLGMSQVFEKDGTVVPVTVLQAEPNVVTQIKTVENDGYEAVQVGYQDAVDRVKSVDRSGRVEVAHRHGVNKARKGQFEKAGVSSKKYLREFRFENSSDYKPGDEIKVDIFAEGDHVDVTGISKGKGYSGAVKMGQHRGPMAHGSKFHRHQGSSGATTAQHHTFPGKLMPSQYGKDQVTVENLVVVKVDTDRNLILVKGAVPGPKKGLITVKETVKSVV